MRFIKGILSLIIYVVLFLQLWGFLLSWVPKYPDPTENETLWALFLNISAFAFTGIVFANFVKVGWREGISDKVVDNEQNSL